jgi:hypothetical protein
MSANLKRKSESDIETNATRVEHEKQLQNILNNEQITTHDIRTRSESSTRFDNSKLNLFNFALILIELLNRK